MNTGMFRKIDGWWFDILWTYMGHWLQKHDSTPQHTKDSPAVAVVADAVPFFFFFFFFLTARAFARTSQETYKCRPLKRACPLFFFGVIFF